jgi:hypothetical protein
MLLIKSAVCDMLLSTHSMTCHSKIAIGPASQALMKKTRWINTRDASDMLQVQDVEGRLPPKISVVVKCPMSAYQAAIYNWVKATNTIRVDPMNPRHKTKVAREWEPLQNKVMELRKVRSRQLCYHSEAKGGECMGCTKGGD